MPIYSPQLTTTVITVTAMEQQTTSKCDKYAANSALNKHHILGTSLYLHIFPAIPIFS